MAPMERRRLQRRTYFEASIQRCNLRSPPQGNRLMMPEIVLSDAPLLKAISGDLASLRQHAYGVLVVWLIVSALAFGVAREFSIAGIKIDITKVPASIGLLVFVASVVWLCLACYLTAEAIAGYK